MENNTNIINEEIKFKIAKNHLRDIEKLISAWIEQFQPYPKYRWFFLIILIMGFLARVIKCQGWYVLAYTLGIYLLNGFLEFLSPKYDPALEKFNGSQLSDFVDDLKLPTKKDEEFRPFVRRLPEFIFWIQAIKATTISLICSFFDIFDLPVFWPILLIYFIILVIVTMRRQIRHMIKYNYIPFDLGKKSYG